MKPVCNTVLGLLLFCATAREAGAQVVLTNWTGGLYRVLSVRSVEGWQYIITRSDTPGNSFPEQWHQFVAYTNGQFLLPDLESTFPKMRYYSVTSWRVFGTNRDDGNALITQATPCFAFRNPDSTISEPRLMATPSLMRPFTNVVSSVVRLADRGTYVVEFQSRLEASRFYRLSLP